MPNDYVDWMEPDEREPEILFPAKVTEPWKAKAARWIAARQQDPETNDIAEILGMFLYEMQRTAAAEQRCKMLERKVAMLANWSAGADARLDMMEDMHPREIRARHLAMMAPDWPAVREEHRLSDGTVLVPAGPDDDPFADPWSDGHGEHECNYPCPKHDPHAFYAQEALRYNVREIA